MRHDPRCEHSKAKRCRCDCHGTQHGIHAHETGTYTDERAPGELYPGMRDDLKRAGQQLAQYREEMRLGLEAAREMQLR